MARILDGSRTGVEGAVAGRINHGGRVLTRIDHVERTGLTGIGHIRWARAVWVGGEGVGIMREGFEGASAMRVGGERLGLTGIDDGGGVATGIGDERSCAIGIGHVGSVVPWISHTGNEVEGAGGTRVEHAGSDVERAGITGIGEVLLVSCLDMQWRERVRSEHVAARRKGGMVWSVLCACQVPGVSVQCSCVMCVQQEEGGMIVWPVICARC